jgi:hypothetical protein
MTQYTCSLDAEVLEDRTRAGKDTKGTIYILGHSQDEIRRLVTKRRSSGRAPNGCCEARASSTEPLPTTLLNFTHGRRTHE